MIFNHHSESRSARDADGEIEMSRSRRRDWQAGSARVVPDMDSHRSHMKWNLEAFRFRRWETIASFTRDGIPLAQQMADDLNALEPDDWNRFFENTIFPVMQRRDPTAWG